MFIDLKRSDTKPAPQDTQTQDAQARYASPDFNLESFLEGLEGLNVSRHWFDEDWVNKDSPNDILKHRDEGAIEYDCSQKPIFDQKIVENSSKFTKPSILSIDRDSTKVLSESESFLETLLSNRGLSDKNDTNQVDSIEIILDDSSSIDSIEKNAKDNVIKINDKEQDNQVPPQLRLTASFKEKFKSRFETDSIDDEVLMPIVKQTNIHSDVQLLSQAAMNNSDNAGNTKVDIVIANQALSKTNASASLDDVTNIADDINIAALTANAANPKNKPKKTSNNVGNDGGNGGNNGNGGNDSKVEKVIKKPKKPKGRFLKRLLSFLMFLLLVILPWLLVVNYVLNIAHPRYTTVSEVVVKQVSETNVSTGSGISALLGVNNTNTEDVKYLTEYILSNDMVKKLDQKFDFQNAYGLDGSDFVYELPSNATQEELLEYFKKRVRISLDETTSVLTVSTEGFNPHYALELNKDILRVSDEFINRISQEVASDQLQFAQVQLDKSEKRLNDAKEQLISYQNSNQVFDPQANAVMVNQLIGNLQAQLSKLRTEESQLLSYLNPEAPQVVSIRSQIGAVEKQILEEQSKLTSSTNSKLNRQTIQFEGIKNQVIFATELYKISLSSLEKSSLESYRKMKNLIVITSPYQAEEAKYPRVHYVIWTSLVFLLMFYGFLRLVLAVVKDHRS